MKREPKALDSIEMVSNNIYNFINGLLVLFRQKKFFPSESGDFNKTILEFKQHIANFQELISKIIKEKKTDYLKFTYLQSMLIVIEIFFRDFYANEPCKKIDMKAVREKFNTEIDGVDNKKLATDCFAFAEALADCFHLAMQLEVEGDVLAKHFFTMEEVIIYFEKAFPVAEPANTARFFCNLFREFYMENSKSFWHIFTKEKIKRIAVLLAVEIKKIENFCNYGKQSKKISEKINGYEEETFKLLKAKNIDPIEKRSLQMLDVVFKLKSAMKINSTFIVSAIKVVESKELFCFEQEDHVFLKDCFYQLLFHFFDSPKLCEKVVFNLDNDGIFYQFLCVSFASLESEISQKLVELFANLLKKNYESGKYTEKEITAFIKEEKTPKDSLKKVFLEKHVKIYNEIRNYIQQDLQKKQQVFNSYFQPESVNSKKRNKKKKGKKNKNDDQKKGEKSGPSHKDKSVKSLPKEDKTEEYRNNIEQISLLISNCKNSLEEEYSVLAEKDDFEQALENYKKFEEKILNIKESINKLENLLQDTFAKKIRVLKNEHQNLENLYASKVEKIRNRISHVVKIKKAPVLLVSEKKKNKLQNESLEIRPVKKVISNAPIKNKEQRSEIVELRKKLQLAQTELREVQEEKNKIKKEKEQEQKVSEQLEEENKEIIKEKRNIAQENIFLKKENQEMKSDIEKNIFQEKVAVNKRVQITISNSGMRKKNNKLVNKIKNLENVVFDLQQQLNFLQENAGIFEISGHGVTKMKTGIFYPFNAYVVELPQSNHCGDESYAPEYYDYRQDMSSVDISSEIEKTSETTSSLIDSEESEISLSEAKNKCENINVSQNSIAFCNEIKKENQSNINKNKEHPGDQYINENN